MVSIGTIRTALPPFRNEKKTIKHRQDTEAIMQQVCKTHGKYEIDYDQIYQYFDTGDIYSTSKRIFDFLKNNLVYNAESGKEQSVKSPSAILHPGENIDCKHYSLFIGGVLDAIQAHETVNWDWFYRFASYDSDPQPGHVFVVVTDRGKEIWIDPVLTNFNQRKQPTFTEDIKPMALVEISGVNDRSENSVMIEVSPALASSNFLSMLGDDLFSLKRLMKSDPAATNGPVRQYFESRGVNWENVLALMNS